MTTEPKWPCGCPKYKGPTKHVHEYYDWDNRTPTCQVLHDHWEGPVVCGNPLPCKTHGR